MGATKVRNLIQASEAHMADCRFRNLSSRTLDLYGYIEEDFLRYLRHEELPLALHALNTENVRGWARWHLEHAHGRGKRDGESVIRTGVGILKTWSRWMVGEDLLEADYTARVKRPKTTRTARQPYEAWELQALRGAMADTITGTRDVAMLTLLIDTGVRVHELMSLRLDDLDLTARRMKVVWGKGRKERYLPFGSSDERDGGRSVRRIREYLKTRRVSPRCPQEHRDVLWMTYDGLPFTQGGFQGHFRKLARRAGLTHTEVHATRHAQPLTSPVLTPAGWRTMGELRVGDEVVGSDGQPTTVIGVYPQGVQDVLRVRFADGGQVRCTPDHLWTVRRGLMHYSQYRYENGGARAYETLSTQDIVKRGGQWYVPVPSPIEFGHRELPMDPYTLGALLGDGHFGSNLILTTATGELEVISRIKSALPVGHAISGVPGRWLISGGTARPWSNHLLSAARSLGLDGTRSLSKSIPQDYLNASLFDRRELLRGLMDTDGYASTRGAAVFTTISPQLAQDVVRLTRSLGGTARMTSRLPYRTAKNIAHRVTLRTPFNPFHMERKKERYNATKKVDLKRAIEAIEPDGRAECVCIEVANSDGLYVTQDYVLTHNTFAVNYLVRASLRGNHNPVEELRYLLGHLSEDTYRIYIGQAGQIISEMEGTRSISDQLLNGEAMASRLRLVDKKGGGAGAPAMKPGTAVPNRPSGVRRSPAL
jgi:site-specific recombinase XerD